MDIPAQTQRQPGPVPPPADTLSAALRISPSHKGGSSLYDSYELRAITKQLKKAIQGSDGPPSPYLCYLKSPFCRRRLHRICRENAKSPKRICSRKFSNETVAGGGGRGSKSGFVMQLWRKVKGSLFWKK